MNDLSKAIEIITDHYSDQLLRDQYHRVERWLAMLPAGTTQNSAGLLAIRARLHETTGNFAEMKASLDQMESCLDGKVK